MSVVTLRLFVCRDSRGRIILHFSRELSICNDNFSFVLIYMPEKLDIGSHQFNYSIK